MAAGFSRPTEDELQWLLEFRGRLESLLSVVKEMRRRALDDPNCLHGMPRLTPNVLCSVESVVRHFRDEAGAKLISSNSRLRTAIGRVATIYEQAKQWVQSSRPHTRESSPPILRSGDATAIDELRITVDAFLTTAPDANRGSAAREPVNLPVIPDIADAWDCPADIPPVPSNEMNDAKSALGKMVSDCTFLINLARRGTMPGPDEAALFQRYNLGRPLSAKDQENLMSEAAAAIERVQQVYHDQLEIIRRATWAVRKSKKTPEGAKCSNVSGPTMHAAVWLLSRIVANELQDVDRLLPIFSRYSLIDLPDVACRLDNESTIAREYLRTQTMGPVLADSGQATAPAAGVPNGETAVMAARPKRRRRKAKSAKVAPPESRPLVVLRGLTEKPIVCGKEVDRLTEARYVTLESLLGAGRDGMKKSDLETKSKRSDAVRYLRQLRESSPLWKRAIRMAGGPWQRYAIVWK